MTWWSKLFSLCPEDIFEDLFFFFTKSLNFSVVFRLWGKHFVFLSKKNLLGCQNSFQVSRNIFGRVCFWKQIRWNVSLYLVFGHKFLEFRRKFCDRFVKTAFYVSSGDFWLDCFFYESLWVFTTVFGLWGKDSGTLAQNLQKVCQNAIHVDKKVLRKNWFLKKKLLQFFRVPIKNFADFCQNMLSKRKVLSRAFFLGKKTHVFQRKLREKVFGVR